MVHEIGIVRLQPDVISCIERIVCVATVDDFPLVFDDAFVLVVVGVVVIVTNDDDEDDTGDADDDANDKSGGGCLDRIMLKLVMIIKIISFWRPHFRNLKRST